MQYFINPGALKFAYAEVFGARARYYLLSVVALALALTAGPALAMLWLGGALLVGEACNAIAARLGDERPGFALALDAARVASCATAPALAWQSGGVLGATAAVALLALLAVDTALQPRTARIETVIIASPLALVTLAIALASGLEAAALAACALVIGYAFAAALAHAHASASARSQDREWLRLSNLGAVDTAAWEIDYSARRVLGAERLASLIGRPVCYEDVVNGALFATPECSGLVREAFGPIHGQPRHLSFEHQLVRGNGAVMRLSHRAFMRAAPDGRPLRLSCLSRRGDGAEALRGEAIAALAIQSEAMKTLGNELSRPMTLGPSALEALSEDLAGALRTLTARGVSLERDVDALARARHAAESANLAKSQFLTSMSHELRTPLNAIIGYAEMLQEDALEADNASTVQDLDRILTAARHLLSLISEILDLSKIEAGRMDATPVEFDPMELLAEAIETIRPLAAQNGDTLRLVSPPSGLRARTDALKLRQCVLNLLSNAAKFTTDGHIDVAITQRRHNGVMQLFVSVSDTGIGMSNEQIGRLFQPFVQADPAITQRYGGTGLGLTITRRFAQLLGGDVLVHSALGQGSTFTLHVPADFGDAAAALGAAAAIDELQGAKGAPLVLVIEDEPDARELAARALTRAGFSVQGVGGGEAGLALARAKSPALILLDIYLPDRSGWRVLQSLKHDPNTRDIPVIVLTVSEDHAHALSLGAAEHMIKPADRDVLAATVMRLARRGPAETAQAIATPARLAGRGLS